MENIFNDSFNKCTLCDYDHRNEETKAISESIHKDLPVGLIRMLRTVDYRTFQPKIILEFNDRDEVYKVEDAQDIRAFHGNLSNLDAYDLLKSQGKIEIHPKND